VKAKDVEGLVIYDKLRDLAVPHKEAADIAANIRLGKMDMETAFVAVYLACRGQDASTGLAEDRANKFVTFGNELD
jgi:hypothetical protein